MNILSQLALEIKALIPTSIIDYAPDNETADFNKEIIIICPAAIKYEKSTRGEDKATLNISIGVFKRITKAEIITMIDKVNNITTLLLNTRLLNNSCICKEVINDDILDMQGMKNNLFISFLHLRYETI